MVYTKILANNENMGHRMKRGPVVSPQENFETRSCDLMHLFNFFYNRFGTYMGNLMYNRSTASAQVARSIYAPILVVTLLLPVIAEHLQNCRQTVGNLTDINRVRLVEFFSTRRSIKLPDCPLMDTWQPLATITGNRDLIYQ